MPGGNIEDHFRYEERIEAGGAVALGEAGHLFGKGNEPADTAREYHPDAVVIKVGSFSYAGIFNCFIAGADGSLCEPVEFTRFFFVEIIERVEVFQFAGEPRFEFRGVEQGDKVGAGNTCKQAFPVIGEIVAKRSDGPNTCYNYAF